MRVVAPDDLGEQAVDDRGPDRHRRPPAASRALGRLARAGPQVDASTSPPHDALRRRARQSAHADATRSSVVDIPVRPRRRRRRDHRRVRAAPPAPGRRWPARRRDDAPDDPRPTRRGSGERCRGRRRTAARSTRADRTDADATAARPGPAAPMATCASSPVDATRSRPGCPTGATWRPKPGRSRRGRIVEAKDPTLRGRQRRSCPQMPSTVRQRRDADCGPGIEDAVEHRERRRAARPCRANDAARRARRRTARPLDVDSELAGARPSAGRSRRRDAGATGRSVRSRRPGRRRHSERSTRVRRADGRRARRSHTRGVARAVPSGTARRRAPPPSTSVPNRATREQQIARSRGPTAVGAGAGSPDRRRPRRRRGHAAVSRISPPLDPVLGNDRVDRLVVERRTEWVEPRPARRRRSTVASAARRIASTADESSVDDSASTPVDVGTDATDPGRAGSVTRSRSMRRGTGPVQRAAWNTIRSSPAEAHHRPPGRRLRERGRAGRRRRHREPRSRR